MPTRTKTSLQKYLKITTLKFFHNFFKLKKTSQNYLTYVLVLLALTKTFFVCIYTNRMVKS